MGKGIKIDVKYFYLLSRVLLALARFLWDGLYGTLSAGKNNSRSTVMQNKVILVTGGAKRIGAAIVRELHQCGARLIVHYHRSQSEAIALVATLNQQRPDSAAAVSKDLLDIANLPAFIKEAAAIWGQLDGIVNNASSFFATPVSLMTESAWEDLIGTNLKAPLFLVQAAAPWLAERQGAIVNIADIHAQQPMREHVIYSIAKAGLVAMTRSLALELAPHVRVNAVAPGTNLWPEGDIFAEEVKSSIINSIPLARTGAPEDIARLVHFLLNEASYITGQIINVDGGRSITLC
jgi:pteridine reductase